MRSHLTQHPVQYPVLALQHPQTRFVCVQSIALLLGKSAPSIQRIDCWRRVIHVVGPGFSTFVSYADLPPILGVAVPHSGDRLLWRRRWRSRSGLAPACWKIFYAQQLGAAASPVDLWAWTALIDRLGFVWTNADRQELAQIAQAADQRFLVAA